MVAKLLKNKRKNKRGQNYFLLTSMGCDPYFLWPYFLLLFLRVAEVVRLRKS